MAETKDGEFGHSYAKFYDDDGRPVFIDSWGTGPFTLRHAGKTWRFSDSDRFGPCFLNKEGREAKSEPKPGSPFWRAHHLWRQQGRMVKGGRECVFDWVPPRPTTYCWVGRKRWVVEDGDHDGDFVEVPFTAEIAEKLKLYPPTTADGLSDA